MNISSNSFNGPEMSATPANYSMSDGVLSGTGVSSANNVGYHLSDAAPAAMDKAQGLAPSGAVSDTLGGKELLASNDVPSYQPSMGGSYFKPATAGGDSASSGLTGLKAEPMSLLKPAHPAIGHTPSQGAVDHIGHQTKGALHASNQTSNSASTTAHSSQPAAHIEARQIAAKPPAAEQMHQAAQPKHVMDRVSHVPSHHVAAHAAHPQVERASAQIAKPGAEHTTAGSDQTAMNNAGADRASSYSVQRGDNLWDIAKKQLGDGSRWSEIYKLNSDTIGSNPDLIHSGLDLKMPGADTTQISDAGNYTVQPGDNLWDIAKDKLGDGSRWGEIFNANKAVIGDNPSLILPGEHFQLPGSQPILTQAAPPPQTMAMQVDPNAAAAQAMPSQAMAPQYQAPVESAPQQVSYLSGPGAAGAATLDPTQLPNQGPVSASLAPDLSFLYTNGKH
jgi:nucleoid-associated protein YgaU